MRPGHEEVGASKLGIEEHPGAEVDGCFHPGHAGPLQGPHECALRIVGCHRLHVADGGGRGVAVGPVDDRLHLHSLSVGDVPAEVPRDHERHQHAPFVQETVDLRLPVDHPGQVEVLRVEEGLHEGPAYLRLVVVQDGKRDVLDVQADGEAEHEKKEQGDHEKHPQRGGVTGDLAKLLDHDCRYAHPAHCAASPFRSIRRMKTSSREGTIRA